jgi:subfamily B ATP-binding cassette protein HlyB/CyaB
MNAFKPNPDAHMRDPGLTALVVIARFHGIAADAAQLRHAAGLGTRVLDANALVLSARSLGLKVRMVRLQPERIARAALPALVLDREGRHFVLARCDDANALVLDADSATPSIVSLDTVTARTTGWLILFASRASLAGELARFDFSWFIPAIVRYRRLLLEVLGVSLVLQLFGLVSPLMFQIVMDKVLVNRTYTTLNVVCVTLLVASAFEVLLTGLRNYVFAHTTNRIDVELGARLFRHLVALPLGYFRARRVGDTVARVRELENIRNFLTGQALTAVIDLTFSFVFIGVMCVYSVWLTLLVVASLPVYAAISALLMPAFRTRLNEKFARGAHRRTASATCLTKHACTSRSACGTVTRPCELQRQPWTTAVHCSTSPHVPLLRLSTDTRQVLAPCWNCSIHRPDWRMRDTSVSRHLQTGTPHGCDSQAVSARLT